MLVQLGATPTPTAVHAFPTLVYCTLEVPKSAAAALSGELDPTRELDRVNYAPGVVSLFADVRAAAQAQPKARLTIVGEGSQYVDGIENLAEVASLLPGVHHVLVVADDGRRDFATLSLDPGQRLSGSPGLPLRLRSGGRPTSCRATPCRVCTVTLRASSPTSRRSRRLSSMALARV